MKKLFDLIADRHQAITKHAMLGKLLTVAKKHPMKTMGAVGTTAEVAGSAAQGSKATAASKNLNQAKKGRNVATGATL